MHQWILTSCRTLSHSLRAFSSKMHGVFSKMPGVLAYGRAAVGVPKPGITFPLHLMFTLFVAGYSCEYLALGSKLSL